MDIKTIIQERSEPVPESGCWVWMASMTTAGYGDFFVDGVHLSAHRASLAAHRGQIPKGMHVLHKCDVRCCVNPNHLYVGTNADNIRDRMKRGPKTGAIGEKSGRAILTEQQVLEIRNRRAAGEKYTEIAEDYGVHKSTVRHAVSGRNWSHL